MRKVLEDGIENGKSQFSIEIFVCKFKMFSKNFNVHWFIAQTRKNLPQGFVITFRIIKEFHPIIRPSLIFIKILI